MGLSFASLGSGSKGNATLVATAQICVMIDCGFSMRETLQRLAERNVAIEQLDAILLTHEHGDHIKSAGSLSRKYAIPVWATRGTARHETLYGMKVNHINVDEYFELDDLQIQAFPVPHDAREPCQFIFSDGNARLGLLTDTGSITPYIEQQLSGCDALLLECNHDTDMLMQGTYPEYLKQRVAGTQGHLSNHQASALLKAIDTSRLKHVVAMHLSEKNNTTDLVQQALSAALDCEQEWVAIAEQQHGLDWRTAS